MFRTTRNTEATFDYVSPITGQFRKPQTLKIYKLGSDKYLGDIQVQDYTDLADLKSVSLDYVKSQREGITIKSDSGIDILHIFFDHTLQDDGTPYPDEPFLTPQQQIAELEQAMHNLEVEIEKLKRSDDTRADFGKVMTEGKQVVTNGPEKAGYTVVDRRNGEEVKFRNSRQNVEMQFHMAVARVRASFPEYDGVAIEVDHTTDTIHVDPVYFVRNQFVASKLASFIGGLINS